MKKREIKKVFGKEENQSYKIKRNSFFIIIIILFLLAFFTRRYFNLFTLFKHLSLVNLVSLIGAIAIIFSFHLLDKSFNINFKKRHYFFAYFMPIVGILMSFLYFKYPYYDKIQHFFFPMMYASAIFFILSKQRINIFYKLLFTFFIVIGSLSIFELLEYYLDILFNWKLQGVFIENPSTIGGYELVLDRIDDTMIDISLGVVGTLIYILSVSLILKNRNN